MATLGKKAAAPAPAPAAVVERLVTLACHAPSVHNTQPWLWEYDGSRLTLRADLRRHLPAEDPQGRNLAISCGAALHHLQFAARALGWDTAVWRMPQHADPTVLAQVAVGRGPGAGVSRADLQLLRRRCTDRRRFTAWPVPEERLEPLCRLARTWGAGAVVVAATAERFRLELIANEACAVAEQDTGLLREQNRWVGRTGTDGVPLAVLPDNPHPHRRSRFGTGALADRWMAINSGDGVIALGGDTDNLGSWLRTGEALSALWLEATREGLSVVPLSQPIEIETTRREIEQSVLGGALSPHILLRIGWQPVGRSELPRTPRRSLGEVLTS
ncbi:MAG TPA: hypothetical protein VNS81_02140 [Nocardioides sp.]|nr:hypothetical protein [Nocardioides sp.]